MTDSASDATFDAAAALDELLDADDGRLLAALALYRNSLVTLFGRDGVVEFLRRAIDSAPHVDYLTRRSRREIDPARPQANLKVDDVAAMKAYPELIPARCRPNGKLGTGVTPEEQEDILKFKTSILLREVCTPMADEMNAALQRHWTQAKAYLKLHGADEGVARMLLTNMFSVRVATTVSPSPEKHVLLAIVL